LWRLLGEAESACRLIGHAALPPKAHPSLDLLLRGRGISAIAGLSGLSVTEEEAALAVQGRLSITAEDKPRLEQVLNIAKAIIKVGESLRAKEIPPLFPVAVKWINRLVLDQFESAEGAIPGEPRMIDPAEHPYPLPAAADCQELLSRLCAWLNGPAFTAPEHASAHGFIKAALAHLHLLWIQPFEAGNGRTARLVELALLAASGAPLPVAYCMAIHYRRTVEEFHEQVQRAAISRGNFYPFLLYAASGFVNELDRLWTAITAEQRRAVWRDYVNSALEGRSKPGHERRKQLLMALSDLSGPASVAGVLASRPDLAETYANLSSKTLTRDINSLIALGLAKREDGGVRACTDVIKGIYEGDDDASWRQ
jgi:Fic family protein